ncbi:MAG: FtsQ-type POTRA domain-containing protein [Sphaerochaetaceae bacterium]|nr:FtsQ-type POTRA domain-containing protein [Sphaerochaetaceae bacterium]
MKNNKLMGFLLVILFVIILLGALYFAARSISYFDITEVNVTVTGQSGTINSDLVRISNRLKGMNIFEVSVSSIRNTIKSFDSVVSVNVQRYFPSTINIEVVYQDYQVKFFAYSETGRTLYLADSSSMHEVDEATYSLYSSLAAVELNPAYALLVDKWGYDQGFYQMLVLTGPLGANNLITDIKYDNNNSDKFGMLVLEMSGLNTALYVREPVTSERLMEALDLISRNKNDTTESVRYDLYSTALVKRK